MIKKLTLVFLALLVAAPPVWAVGEISPSRGANTHETGFTLFRFGTGEALDESTVEIPVCPDMAVSFDQATAANITIWAVDEGEADPEANGTSLKSFTASSTGIERIYPDKNYIVAWVDVAETSGRSVLKIYCSNSLAKGVDPSYTVRFETAALTDDPRVKAYTPVILKELCCVANDGTAPLDQIVRVYECASTGETCVSSGLQIEADALDTEYCSTTITDDRIDEGDFWGAFTESFTTAASALDCTVHAERG